MEALGPGGVSVSDVLESADRINRVLMRQRELWMTARNKISILCTGAFVGVVLLSPAIVKAESVQLVAAGVIDEAAGTVTLPLQQGRMTSGETVWYVILDTDDRETADRLGINFSNKLSNAGTGRAVRQAELSEAGEPVFAAGRVDFTPERVVEPGPAEAPFPPARAEPGSVGDDDYTPLVRIGDSGAAIFNAPVLAFDESADELNQFCGGAPDYARVHDKVVSICPRTGAVTLSLTDGFAGGEILRYVSTESNVALVAALEGATHAPRLGDIPAGLNDAPWSAVEPIYVVINGDTGADAPTRQGLTSALADGLSPLNITGDVPGLGKGYSPLWASHPLVWADAADGKRELLSSEAQVRAAAVLGQLQGVNGGPVRADGILVNCPVISRVMSRK